MLTTKDQIRAMLDRLPDDCNEVKHINRVLYDVTSKPPGTIEWE